jgi:hypothetical protein
MSTPVITPSITQFGWMWLKSHERLIMLALVLAVGTFGLSKYFDVDAARKEAKYVAAEQIVANDAKNSAALALQTAQTTAQYQALVQTLADQNARLSASIAQRTASGAAQRTVDSTLPVSGLVARWTILVPTVVPMVTPNGVMLNEQGVRDTVSQLELVPVLQGNLADETKIALDNQQQALKADALVSIQSTQITGLNTQIADQTKACTAQVAAVKAEGKKNSMKWFKRGFGLGFLSGLFVGHAAGI